MSNTKLVEALEKSAFIVIQGEWFRVRAYDVEDKVLYFDNEDTGDSHQHLLEELEVMSIELHEITKIEL